MQKKVFFSNFLEGPPCVIGEEFHNASFLSPECEGLSPLLLCVTLDRSHFLSEPQSLHLSQGKPLYKCAKIFTMLTEDTFQLGIMMTVTLILSPGTGSSSLHVLPHLVFLQLCELDAFFVPI